VKQALAEHQELRQLFDKAAPLDVTLGAIEEKLEAHIRFEERVLFNEIQQKASPAEIEAMEVLQAAPGNRKQFEDWQDEFWK
jgi:hypothetical protein